MNRLVAAVVLLWVAASLALIGCIVTAGPPPVPPTPESSQMSWEADSREARLRSSGFLPTPAASLLWIDHPANDGWWVQKPPSRFMRGQGSALVIFTVPDEVARLCGNPEAQACATRLDGVPVPVIVMPDPCGDPRFNVESFGRLACHENSHAFGSWKHEVA